MTHPAPAAPAAPQGPTPCELDVLRRGLYLIALNALRDADLAEDVAQETVSRLLEALSRADRSVDNWAGFARGIARHIIADSRTYLGRARPLEGIANAVAHASDCDPLKDTIAAEAVARVRGALNTLSADDQYLVRTLFYEDLSPAAYAARVGEPAERVRKRKSRALERLRRAFFGHTTESSATELEDDPGVNR